MTDVYVGSAVKHTDAPQTKRGQEGSESSGSELKDEKVFVCFSVLLKKTTHLGFVWREGRLQGGRFKPAHGIAYF